MTHPVEKRNGFQHVADVLRAAMKKRPPLTPEELAAHEAQVLQLEAEERERHNALQQLLWPEHLRQCGAPPEAVEALLGGKAPRPTPAYGAAVTFLGKGELPTSLRFLVLAGGTGAGKTVAGCFCLSRAVRRETRTGQGLAEWDSSRGLVLRLSRLARRSDFDASDEALFTRAKAAKVLVLDEVQGARPGDFLAARGQGFLNELIDARDRAGARTVITTNLSVDPKAPDLERLAIFIGETAYSRIARSVQVKDCGSVDLRRQHAAGGAR